MKKIVVIGPSGAGKTTLAKTLGSVLKIAVLKINVYHLDHIFWKRGWKKVTRDDRIDISQKIVLQRNQWIVEGNYPDSSKPCLDAADTIIFLDLPPLLCLWRVIKRHREEFGVRRRDLPMDCVDEINWQLIIKGMLFNLTKRPSIMRKLRSYEAKGKEIIICRSTKQVDEFVAKQQELMRDKENTSNLMPSGELILT
jgi:adenylate kinase family enzyme